MAPRACPTGAAGEEQEPHILVLGYEPREAVPMRVAGVLRPMW